MKSERIKYMAEMIDIYDRNRKATGVTLPRKTKLGDDQYMLYVLALIENREHRFLVTRRALDKKWAAGAWEIPGGGSGAGETSLQAVCREVLEETGLDISSCDKEVIYSYRNDDASGDNYFADIYLCHADFDLKDIRIQEEEVVDVKLVTADEITELQERDEFLHYKRIMEALK